ncbi:hypothetical protein [Amycolatopsis echigonensis]|uniref:Uncharacterized protein n=1 Tax=Amycolatopsis echigonensis TaxID=2576905 RepID=A0A8E1VXL7_9PSEU|nr:hypothetical protein [Amycolatopsis echigonensis]MBB2500258.1 hypothetical protein [Amycolatopsis echigonensis]
MTAPAAPAVSATYLDDLSRVRVSWTGFPSAVDSARVERSTDGIRWSVVRGGDTVPVSRGGGHVDDYEFTAGAENTYRVSGADGGPIIGVDNPGTAATADNDTVTPGLPDDWREGDLLLLFAVARKTGFAPALVVPAGWTTLTDRGDYLLCAKRAAANETAPSVAVTGGASGVDVIAQVMAYRNADLPQTATNIVTGSGQDVALPSVSNPPAGSLNLWAAKKDSEWTSAAPSTVYGPIGSTSSALGSGVAMYWDYTVIGAATPVVPQRTLTVTGGAAAVNVGISYVFGKAPYVLRRTASVTPVLSGAWIKVPQRPSLNRRIVVSDISSITRPSRTATHDVIGRTLPVAISDVQGSRRFTLTVMTESQQQADDVENSLLSGLPMFLQACDPGAVIPTAYVVVGDIDRSKQGHRGRRRFLALPMTEVAAPTPTIYGGTYTYQDVLDGYASYAGVLADVVDYSALVDKISDGEIVVP